MSTEELWRLNTREIINNKTLPAVVRLFFVGLKDNPYVLVGEFLKDLTDLDLRILCSLIDTVHESSTESKEKQEYATFVLLTLSMGLAMSEGVTSVNTNESAIASLRALGTFITLESLFRKGLIEFNRDAASFLSTNDVLATVKEPT
jgi:hypothetical protein